MAKTKASENGFSVLMTPSRNESKGFELVEPKIGQSIDA